MQTGELAVCREENGTGGRRARIPAQRDPLRCGQGASRVTRTHSMHWREELGPADQTQAAGREVYKWVMPKLW